MKRKEERNSFAVDKLLGLGPAFSENEIQYNNGYMRGLIEGAEWADKTMIDMACKWIKNHHHEFSFWNTKEYELEFTTEKFIEDFRKAMGE